MDVPLKKSKASSHLGEPAHLFVALYLLILAEV